jgi:hypothetical protein
MSDGAVYNFRTLLGDKNCGVAGLLGLLILAWPALPSAHDIPNDVTIQTFVKPVGQRLRLVVRVPLIAMRDMDYPKPRGATSSDLLDLARAESTLRDASTLWVSDALDLYENDRLLPAPDVVSVRAAVQSDKSFASYDEALAHVTGPALPVDTEFSWSQGLLDVLFEYPVQSEQSHFSINPRLARLGIRTLTVVRFLPPDGSVRAFEFPGDPGLVRLDPRWHEAALQFVKLGFFHILDGADHLLFLFCLVMPFRRLRSLVAVITAFSVAHSITLIASAYKLAPDVLWFPPLITTLIAASIVYMALENIVGASFAGFAGLALKRRWIVTFGFGLVYGFAFSFALRPTLQFAGTHLLTSVLSFNIGVELGQLLVLVLLIPALVLLFQFVVAERMGTIILSTLAAHTAWHEMSERWDVLRRFTFEWPAVDAALLASALRWLMLVVVAAGLYWLVFGVFQAEKRPRDAQDAA